MTTNRRIPNSSRDAQLAARVAEQVLWVLQPIIRDTHNIVARLRRVEKTLHRLEYRMSEVQDVLDALNDATNAVATKQQADADLLAKVEKQLSDALAAGQVPDPQVAADLATALAGIRATTTTLQNLAADPAQPVPSDDPIVGDGGDTTAGEPGTDSGDGSEGNSGPINPPDPGVV